MKKITNLFFLMLLLLCVSCSKDDTGSDDTGNSSNPLVPSLTGAITDNEVNFNNPKLKCTKCAISFLPSTRLATEERYASMTLQFNDNVELVFKGIADIRDTKEADKVYRLLKNCYKAEWNDGSITVNLKNGNKVVSSELFNPPTNSDWWKMASDDSYFTIDLTLNGKQYTYKGQVKYIF